MAMMSERETDGDDIVHVPVPKRLLPAVYRVLADAMAPTASGDTVTRNGVPAEAQVVNRNMIDLIVEAARQIGADRWPMSLTDLYNAYRQAYPGIGKGATRGSFDATVNYHCINMRSRFPDTNDRRKPAYWLSRPVFKRVARAQYMLLSNEELAHFRAAVENDNPLVYEDQFDLADLAHPGEISTAG